MRDAHYIIRGGVEGRQRLRILSRVVRVTTLGLLERIGLWAGMRCLDVGCGGGDVAFDLARRIGANGRVVGVDRDMTKLDLARREAADLQIANVEFRCIDIGADGLRGKFDLVYARFLLTHLPDPVSALGKMRDALAPKGLLAVEDIDISASFCQPPCAAFDHYVELYSQAARHNHADPCIGPRLPDMLADIGLAHIQMNVVQPAGAEGDVKLVAPLTMEAIADAVLAADLASYAEIDQLVAELHEAARDADTIMGLPRIVQAWGRQS